MHSLAATITSQTVYILHSLESVSLEFSSEFSSLTLSFTNLLFAVNMPKRAWPFTPRSGTLSRTHAGFTRRVRSRRSGPGRMPGRFAGYYRKSGYYGRYPGTGGPIGGPELKFLDTTVDDLVIAAGGVVFPSMNLIPQDVGESGRIGRKCVIRKIGWKGRLSLPEMDAQPTPNPGDVIRMSVMLDKQANGAAATGADVLENNTTYDFNNLANKDRFTTLWDKVFSINYSGLASDGAGVVSSGEVQRQFSFFKTVNIPIEFSGATGAIGEIRSNNIFIMLQGAGTIAGLASRVRVRFSDS